MLGSQTPWRCNLAGCGSSVWNREEETQRERERGHCNWNRVETATLGEHKETSSQKSWKGCWKIALEQSVGIGGMIRDLGISQTKNLQEPLQPRI